VHHHQNRITLTRDSLSTGWGRLEQCHSHIDAVPSSQVVYSRDRIRGLRVVRADNIGRVWVQENSVQMENVGRDAMLCVEADTRALASDGQNGYVLRTGPYMRRFLDGYYPMRVSMTLPRHRTNAPNRFPGQRGKFRGPLRDVVRRQAAHDDTFRHREWRTPRGQALSNGRAPTRENDRA
jgi:hypothetical protein